MSNREGEPQIVETGRSEGENPNASIWVKLDTLKTLSKIRGKILWKRDFQGRVTYNDVVVELLRKYDGEYL